MAELPIEEAFHQGRVAIDECLAGLYEQIGPYHLDEDEEPIERVDGAMLAGWIALTMWLDPATGKYHYVRVCSQDLPAHTRLGLQAMWNGDD